MVYITYISTQDEHMSNTVTKKYIIPYVLTHMIGMSKIEDTSFLATKKKGSKCTKK